MPPILFCYLKTSEAGGGGMVVEANTSTSIPLCVVAE